MTCNSYPQCHRYLLLVLNQTSCQRRNSHDCPCLHMRAGCVQDTAQSPGQLQLILCFRVALLETLFYSSNYFGQNKANLALKVKRVSHFCKCRGPYMTRFALHALVPCHLFYPNIVITKGESLYFKKNIYCIDVVTI